ncbi:AfsR/SARP family transcriptional regulator [Micromonospora peucetia]|uniref:AfsR/SARP family transcriptional regulator n=1 Tax=Micromonospora peucetia TaxID=47871 RepID=UPI00331C1312
MNAMTTGMIFGVLGPVVARLPQGDPVALGEPRQRAVMATLLVHTGHTVAWRNMVGLVWGDVVPPSSRKALQVYVSRIRRAITQIPASGIVTQRDGYRLICPSDSIDLQVFRRLVHESRQTTIDRVRHDLLSDALSLWRGAPFADASAEGLHDRVAPLLVEEHLAALEEFYATRIRMGGHVSVVEPLSTAVAEHPTRERLAELLMTAMHLSGRHVDAVRVYQRLRSALQQEMGVQPDFALSALHQIIVDQDRTSVQWASLTANALIERGRIHLEKGDQDWALAALYAARATARDSNDHSSLQIATQILLGLVAAPERRGIVSTGALLAGPNCARRTA